jgi:hypothetical protein
MSAPDFFMASSAFCKNDGLKIQVSMFIWRGGGGGLGEAGLSQRFEV